MTVRGANHARVLGLAAVFAIAVTTLVGAVAPVWMTWGSWGPQSEPDLAPVLAILAASLLAGVLCYLAAFLVVTRRRPRRADYRNSSVDTFVAHWRGGVLLLGFAAWLVARLVESNLPANPIGPAGAVSGNYVSSLDAASLYTEPVLRVVAPIDAARDLVWIWLCLTVVLTLGLVIAWMVVRMADALGWSGDSQTANR